MLKDNVHFYLLLDIHHIIGDGITLKVLLADIEAAYNGKALEPEAMTMMDVALAEAEKRQTPAFEEDKQWYAKTFDCGDTFTMLIPDLEGTERSEANKVRVLGIDKEKIETFCKANGIYKNTFFTAAYAYFLAKYNNEQEALFTTVYNGRNDQRFLHSVGMTVKTLPVYAKFTDDTSVLDFLKACQEQNTGCREHDIYAYSDAVADLNLQSNSLFAWRGDMLSDIHFMGKPTKVLQLCNHTLEVPLCLMVYMVGNQYHLRAEYNASQYSEALISQFMESYEATLEAFLSHVNLRDICFTTDSQVKLLDSFNNTDCPYDETQTIVSLFRRQAKSTPDKVAVVYKERRFTYAELDEMSDRIAAYIASKGLGPEDIVAILIPRSEWMAIASLGVIKAGCAYQPLDPTYPKERLNFMMQDTAARLLIADAELRPIVDEYQGDVIFTKDLMHLPAAGTLPKGPKPESLFTLVYTSGSTGVPKGGMSEHRNWVAFCQMHQKNANITSESRVTSYASFGFDASPMEIYATLTIGAELHIIPEEMRLDLLALNDSFERNSITHAFMTTQVAYQFVTSIENHSLQVLMTGGEKLASLTPPQHYRVMNGYGPSETICYVTSYWLKGKQQNIPIGAAIANCKLYIIDPQGHRLPIGASGELWIAGPQVARGYLNRPEKTAEVFVTNPFCEDGKYNRIYKSGDIVRYLPDGNIQFVGRQDGQVKIRGFRIELKEVEAVIREYPGIKDATVQAFDVDDGEHQSSGGGKFIAAYIVSDEQIDIEALNSFILDQKPPYMVPAVTMQIEAIPLNQNQKVNKKALPKPEKKAAVAEVESNVPMNVLEKEIHGIIAQIINTEDFGITTILGYVGLTSIMAIKLAIQINKRFGVTLDSKTLAKTGSVQSIENEILTTLMQGGATKQEDTKMAHADMSNIPLSYAQMGVYVDSIKNPESTIYNTPVIARFPQNVDIKLLTKAVVTLVKTHPMLQAHFDSAGADIVQIVDLEQPVEIAHSQCKEKDIPRYKWEFVKPFNLRQGPLYRMEIVTTEQWVYLMMDIHHLVVDGGSFYLNALKGDGIRSQTSSVFVNGGTYTMDVGNSTWCQGIRADVNLEIRGGYITVSSGHRGFLAQKIATSGGITYVNSSDDGWKADTIHRERTDTMVYIGGGNHYINAEGDGIDSDGYFEMRSGLVIIVASKDNSHSPLECGTYSQITINGGTLIAYGNDGQVQSLYGNQNTVVVKNHQKVNPNNYYVIRAGYSYYGIKITKESAAICASFAEYSNNEYAIILANYIEPEYVIWANVGFYKLRTFGYVKTICNGAFHGTNNQHPEHSSSPWNVPTGWGYGGFWY